jgi:TPR repeat protein
MKLRVLAVSLACLLTPMAAQAQDEAPELPDQIPRWTEATLIDSCDNGNAEVCSILGGLYLGSSLGIFLGVAEDDFRGASRYRQACDGGDTGGCVVLGFMYEQDRFLERGFPRDFARAAALYRQGCEAGVATGCSRLATMYEDGRGVMQDDVRAHALFNIGAWQGDKDFFPVETRAEYNQWIEAQARRGLRDAHAGRITAQQIADGEALARRCTQTSVAECLR